MFFYDRGLDKVSHQCLVPADDEEEEGGGPMIEIQTDIGILFHDRGFDKMSHLCLGDGVDVVRAEGDTPHPLVSPAALPPPVATIS